MTKIGKNMLCFPPGVYCSGISFCSPKQEIQRIQARGFGFSPYSEGTKIPGKERKAVKRSNMPSGEKYTLTISEASRYYRIGIKRLRRLAEEHLGDFAVFSGNRYLIIREKFEEYITQTSAF